jgi:hypothetical protein
MLSFASCLKISPLRCGLVPAPEEAKEYLPGLSAHSLITGAMRLRDEQRLAPVIKASGARVD